jgi:hypothetical protein
MRKFNEFKESIIETFTEMDAECFLEDGEYLYQKEIVELRAVTNFTDMARILVDCEYWDFSDAMMYSREVIEENKED